MITYNICISTQFNDQCFFKLMNNLQHLYKISQLRPKIYLYLLKINQGKQGIKCNLNVFKFKGYNL